MGKGPGTGAGLQEAKPLSAGSSPTASDRGGPGTRRSQLKEGTPLGTPNQPGAEPCAPACPGVPEGGARCSITPLPTARPAHPGAPAAGSGIVRGSPRPRLRRPPPRPHSPGPAPVPAPRSPLPAPRPGPRGRAGGGPGRSRVADGSSPATAPRLSRPGFCPSGRQVPVPDTLAKAVPTLSLASV